MRGTRKFLFLQLYVLIMSALPWFMRFVSTNLNRGLHRFLYRQPSENLVAYCLSELTTRDERCYSPIWNDNESEFRDDLAFYAGLILATMGVASYLYSMQRNYIGPFRLLLRDERLWRQVRQNVPNALPEDILAAQLGFYVANSQFIPGTRIHLVFDGNVQRDVLADSLEMRQEFLVQAMRALLIIRNRRQASIERMAEIPTQNELEARLHAIHLDSRAVPDHFNCPLSHTIMAEPVQLILDFPADVSNEARIKAMAHSFELKFVELLLQQPHHAICPITRYKIIGFNMNDALREEIRSWVQRAEQKAKAMAELRIKTSAKALSTTTTHFALRHRTNTVTNEQPTLRRCHSF